MTNKEILDIAMQQSAYDTNAKASDFLMDTNVFVKSGIGPLQENTIKNLLPAIWFHMEII